MNLSTRLNLPPRLLQVRALLPITAHPSPTYSSPWVVALPAPHPHECLSSSTVTSPQGDSAAAASEWPLCCSPDPALIFSSISFHLISRLPRRRHDGFFVAVTLFTAKSGANNIPGTYGISERLGWLVFGPQHGQQQARGRYGLVCYRAPTKELSTAPERALLVGRGHRSPHRRRQRRLFDKAVG
ncbi:hypothetical protein B0T26DRAFT_510694 [Lasiosphaeria miniovina]|uniref:Uncharacterized protein n=1 Tax=Lasiosphaeria miniovina TaxID=1954250 RepID=A0AA39ZUF6_9PEZI|nr:uncharacterized protein B0T26DRAFT_510694 [Lasiosphaeria miniovina]KAK0703749.1 hypothetical protein B0T26DRAFT_510694 [Lasiosphaeria miniovina]